MHIYVLCTFVIHNNEALCEVALYTVDYVTTMTSFKNFKISLIEANICTNRCHGLSVYAVCVCNKVRLPGTGQSAHVIGGSRFTRPASNSRRTLLN